MTTVSVIVPMRNAAGYIREALVSILSERTVALEVCVVDDGSTDGSADVVRALGDPRVRLLSGPRDGIAACFNTGLAAAQGRIVMRCDADDLFTPGRAQRQVAWLDAHPDFAAVCGGFRTIDAAGKPIAELVIHEHPADEDITDELRRGSTRTHLGAFAIRRDAVPGTDWLRRYFETAEDIDLQLRIAGHGRVMYQPVIDYVYRLHGASITHVQSDARRMRFERQAREFQRQRAATGSDDLMRGVEPQMPPDEGAAAGSDHLEIQLQGMLQATVWQHFAQRRHWAAVQAACRGIGYAPLRRQGWHGLASLLWKIALRGLRLRAG